MTKIEGNICPECGHPCKPRGLGAHLRLKHGIKVTTVVKHLSDLSDSSGKISEKRPSDYLRKKAKVVEVKMEEAPPQTVPEPSTKTYGDWSRRNQDMAGMSQVSEEGYKMFQRIMREANEKHQDK